MSVEDIMLQRVVDFPSQLEEALEIGRQSKIAAVDKTINKVVVLGMGGSGFGANLVAELVYNELKVPYLVSKSYQVPNYIDEHTLVIASSYSGNTEETLIALEQVFDRNPIIVAVTSGGKLLELSKEKGFDAIVVPGGFPPRSCLGYSFVQQLFILNKLGLVSDQVIKDVEAALVLMRSTVEEVQEKGEELASFLFGKLPIVYATDRMASLTLRARQQINENSKMLCWNGVVPEMNHNEVIGWRKKDEDLAVIFLRSKDDFARNQTRMEINKDIIKQYTTNILDIYAKGESLAEQAMYLNSIIDYATVYLGHKNGMDTTEVDVIDFLKGELAKVPL